MREAGLKTEKKETTELNPGDLSYRQSLEALEHSSQEKYDQAVMTLSGGALGITLTFVKEFVTPANDVSCGLLLAAWVLWGISVTAVVFSFFFSQCALRTAIKQVDAGTHREQRLGGIWNTFTAILNILGGFAFFAGVICFVFFSAQAMRGYKAAKHAALAGAPIFQQQPPMNCCCITPPPPPPPPPPQCQPGDRITHHHGERPRR